MKKRAIWLAAAVLRRVKNRVMWLLADGIARIRGAASRGFHQEETRLQRSWADHSPETLDEYLVIGYQNPRINAQSILVRHFLISELFGSIFDPLMDAELRFAVALNEAMRLRALELGVTMGSFLDPEKQAAVRRVSEAVADRETEFRDRWREALSQRRADLLAVIEFACGSANDYRAFDEYGVAAFLDYTGIDLNEANIENARRRFPKVRFEVESILDLPYPDRSFDYVLAADIFEHLSLGAMERALGEAVRLARKGLALTFFNMSNTPEHVQRPRGRFHWNRLSAPRIEDMLRRDFPTVSVTPVASWLDERFGYPHSYNRHAYTIVAERP